MPANRDRRLRRKPVDSSRHVDYFGNATTSFTLLEPHERLVVEATSELEVIALALPDFAGSPHWESVRDSLPFARTDEELTAYQFVFDSSRVSGRPELAEYARESFPPGRPLLEAVLDLTRRINRDFRFDTKATEVSTPVETFFEKRRGVCQDFLAFTDRLHAVTGTARALPQRVSAPPSAPGQAASRRSRCIACMVCRLEPRRRMGGFRSHQ